MGNCLSTNRGRNTGHSSDSQNLSLGKNQALKREKPNWKNEVPITEGQLRSKRDEFWETAPAFEGRKEIWDALKAAACALENDDYELAQAIVDGAIISLPNGTLLDCYDELGNRYQLPLYCITAPINLIEEDSDSECQVSENDTSNERKSKGEEINVKLRLSTSCTDVNMAIYTKENIFNCKKKLAEQEGIDIYRQRWYFGGRLLNDKMKVEDLKLQNDFVIQVVISMPTEKKESSK